MVGRQIIRWVGKSLAALLILAVLCLIATFAFLSNEHKTEITLPTPTGHFAVGRTMDTWVNDAAANELASSPANKREVVVWIWYPAATQTSALPAEYLPAPWREAEAQHSGVLISRLLTRDPGRTTVKEAERAAWKRRGHPLEGERDGAATSR